MTADGPPARPGRDDRARDRHHQGRSDPGRRSSSSASASRKRVLTEPEQRYVRGRPETMAGRWAAKEAVSKVLGLGVRGIGWRDIEIERMPTGQPAVRLHGRAADRAEQLGMERIAVSITPRIGLRGGDRVRGPDGRRALRLPARHRGAARRARAADPRPDRAPPARPRWPVAPRRSRSDAPAAGRRGAAACLSAARSASAGATRRRERPATPATVPFPAGATKLDDDIVAALIPERKARGHKGSFGKLLVIAGSLDYAGAALLVCRAAGRTGVGLVTLAVPESLQPLFAAKVVEATTMALPEDDVEEVDPEPALARILDHEHDAIVVGPGLRPGLATTELVRSLLADRRRDRRGAARPRRRGAPLDGDDRRLVGGRPAAGRPDAARRRVRPPAGGQRRRARRRRRPRRRRRGPARGRASTPPRPGGSVVVLKGARTIIAAPGRERRHRPVREPGARDRRHGRRARRRDRRRSSRRAWTRSPRPGSGVYLHGLAGDAGRERFGDAGLLASDLPDGLAIGPQAPGGHGRAPDRRASGSGSGPVVPSRPSADAVDRRR